LELLPDALDLGALPVCRPRSSEIGAHWSGRLPLVLLTGMTVVQAEIVGVLSKQLESMATRSVLVREAVDHGAGTVWGAYLPGLLTSPF